MNKRTVAEPTDMGDSLYRAWGRMRSRTKAGGPVQRDKPTYVGIECDPRWATFEGFLAHPPAGEFTPGMCLGRIGDVGNYTPENCRWQTKSESAREAREREMVRLPDGRFAADVARENGVGQSTWQQRIYAYGWDIERAVTTPPRNRVAA